MSMSVLRSRGKKGLPLLQPITSCIVCSRGIPSRCISETFFVRDGYASSADGGYGEYFNWIMVTPDHNTADTYYRILQQVKSITQSDANGTPGAKVDITSG
ncbi:uncharacterized protein N7529_011350 [Penicillium soppii]|uniref:uncharacterized protein n=1 Tax=Penicillium soppii TaxID=69789 RepID=UPI0025494014|nr:uncharacterized protein N7529_011350 [Penicillium soppii]KAJ5851965.1 hypothetical protein N7529_011350 [Penicillium soppii]